MIGTWVAVGTGIITALTIGTRFALRQRLLAAQVAPATDVPRASLDQLRERLRGLAGDETPFVVSEAGEILTISWQLHGIPWATILFRQKLRTTWALDLCPRPDGTVSARQRAGKVAWETHAATWMPKALVTWGALAPPAAPPTTDTMPATPGKDTPRSADLLVAIVRQHVLESGYRWHPMVDFGPLPS